MGLAPLGQGGDRAGEWFHAKALARSNAVGPGACLSRPRLRLRAADFSFSGKPAVSSRPAVEPAASDGQALRPSEVMPFDCDVERLATLDLDPDG